MASPCAIAIMLLMAYEDAFAFLMAMANLYAIAIMLEMAHRDAIVFQLVKAYLHSHFLFVHYYNEAFQGKEI